MKTKISSALFILTIATFLIPELLFCQVVSFEKHIIDSDFPGIHVIKVIDLDSDGDYDIVGGSENTPNSTSVGLAWWRNDGGTPIVWTKFTIDRYFLHVMSVDVAKINDDDSYDIVASSWKNGTICWWENSGDPTQSWTKHIIVSNWTNAHCAVSGDLDGDNKVDVVGVGTGNNKISIFYNEDMATNSWSEHNLKSNYTDVLNATIQDIDNDNYPDIIAGDMNGNRTIWWKNLGGRANWNEKIIANTLGNSNSTFYDINLDGQLDLIGASWARNELSYWVSDISTNEWTKNIITSYLGVAVKGIGNDIDQDGDMDIIAIGKEPGELSVFYNDDFSFTRVKVESYFPGGSALSVIDLDKDGDDDIIAGAGLFGDLCFFENKGNIVNVGKINNQALLKIHPNPTSGKIKIDIPNASLQMINVRVIDMNGKTVFLERISAKKDGNLIDLSELNNGVYLLSAQMNNDISLKKIIIRK